MGGFWNSKSPRKLKRVIFLSKVQGAAILGLTSYDWSRKESYAIDSLLVHYLRVLMRGAAFEERLGSKEVLRRWKVCSLGF